MKKYREKYSKRVDSRGIKRFPVAGKDVNYLLDVIDRLEKIIKDLQCGLSTEEQNKIEMKLLFAKNS